MKTKFITGLIAVLLMVSCGPKQVPRERISELESADTTMVGRALIPYDPQGSHEIVTVYFNGVPMNLTWDTGCSTTTIPVTEFQRMIKEGKITGYDYSDTKYAQIADGSIVETFEFNISSVSFHTVDGKPIVLRDANIAVSPNPNSASLLGKNIIDRLGEYHRDEKETCFVLNR